MQWTGIGKKTEIAIRCRWFYHDALHFPWSSLPDESAIAGGAEFHFVTIRLWNRKL